MPSFLTNPKMDPELAARVQASLHGAQKHGARLRRGPRYAALGRFVLWCLVLSGIAVFAWGLMEQRRALKQAQTLLLARIEQTAAQVPASGWKLLATIEEMLARAATATVNDSITTSLREPNTLERLLERPTLYLRASTEQILTPQRLASAAAESTKDAFLYCWIAPPSSRDEAALLREVRSVYRGKALQDPRLTSFHRLHDLFFAVNYLGPASVARVRAARDLLEVSELQTQFDTAEIERVLPALRAEVLIYVLDEPKKPGTPSEIDGAYEHHARVGVVDLRDGRPLLEVRRHLSPSWISDRARPQFASGLGACRLAVELRDEIRRTAE